MLDSMRKSRSSRTHKDAYNKQHCVMWQRPPLGCGGCICLSPRSCRVFQTSSWLLRRHLGRTGREKGEKLLWVTCKYDSTFHESQGQKSGLRQSWLVTRKPEVLHDVGRWSEPSVLIVQLQERPTGDFECVSQRCKDRWPVGSQWDCKDQVLVNNFTSKFGCDSKFGTLEKCLIYWISS